MSEIKSMEHSTLKVPYEVINKKFRAVQKVIDREIDQIQNITRDVNKTMAKSVHPTIAEIEKLVNCVVQRVHMLKRKAGENIADELNASVVCKRKLHHLKGIGPVEQDAHYEIWQASIDKWKRVSRLAESKHIWSQGFIPAKSEEDQQLQKLHPIWREEEQLIDHFIASMQ